MLNCLGRFRLEDSPSQQLHCNRSEEDLVTDLSDFFRFHGRNLLNLTNPHNNKTGLALASILGPFGVHLLKFTVDTHPGSLMHYLGLLEFPVRICDTLHIPTHTRRT